MIEAMGSVTTKALGLAMDAALMRQQVISANIANANTPDYVPLTVSFEAQLADARMVLEDRGRLNPGALAGIHPRVEVQQGAGILGGSPKVMLDMEVANLAKNAIHFEALAKGLSKHFAILSAAIGDGKK